MWWEGGPDLEFLPVLAEDATSLGTMNLHKHGNRIIFPRPHPLSQGPASDPPCQCPMASTSQSQCWLVVVEVCVWSMQAQVGAALASCGGLKRHHSQCCLLGSVATARVRMCVCAPPSPFLASLETHLPSCSQCLFSSRPFPTQFAYVTKPHSSCS